MFTCEPLMFIVLDRGDGALVGDVFQVERLGADFSRFLPVLGGS